MRPPVLRASSSFSSGAPEHRQREVDIVAGQIVDVHAAGPVPAGDVDPQRQDRQRCGGHVADPERATVDTRGDDLPDHGVGAPADLRDLAVVLLRERVQFVLRDPAGGVVHGVDPHETVDDGADPLDRVGGTRGGALDLLEDVVVPVAAGLEEYGLLGREVHVERRGAQPCADGDVAGGGRVVAAACEGLHRGGDQPARDLGSTAWQRCDKRGVGGLLGCVGHGVRPAGRGEGVVDIMHRRWSTE